MEACTTREEVGHRRDALIAKLERAKKESERQQQYLTDVQAQLREAEAALERFPAANAGVPTPARADADVAAAADFVAGGGADLLFRYLQQAKNAGYTSSAVAALQSEIGAAMAAARGDSEGGQAAAGAQGQGGAPVQSPNSTGGNVQQQTNVPQSTRMDEGSRRPGEPNPEEPAAVRQRK